LILYRGAMGVHKVGGVTRGKVISAQHKTNLPEAGRLQRRLLTGGGGRSYQVTPKRKGTESSREGKMGGNLLSSWERGGGKNAELPWKKSTSGRRPQERKGGLGKSIVTSKRRPPMGYICRESSSNPFP